MPAPRPRLAVSDHLERTLPALLLEDVALFAPRGEIDRAAMAALCWRTRSLVRHGQRRVLLDLGRTPHLDYRALPALVRLARHVARQGGLLELCGAGPYLETILCFAGLERLPRHRSRAVALRSPRREGGRMAANVR
jgi:ABC-type transporter Mla MlaB component